MVKWLQNIFQSQTRIKALEEKNRKLVIELERTRALLEHEREVQYELRMKDKT